MPRRVVCYACYDTCVHMAPDSLPLLALAKEAAQPASAEQVLEHLMHLGATIKALTVLRF